MPEILETEMIQTTPGIMTMLETMETATTPEAIQMIITQIMQHLIWQSYRIPKIRGSRYRKLLWMTLTVCLFA